ncbi:FtsK/SpoIIIE family DNA translocase [Thermodesulfobacterium hydrogeniphilum]|uniref:FtsK/SpoIIIE family DNA translocase n=1 Tax=Thermodesulfobacterium hydrogeniphilum TaxID=161156 RepID=UPI00057090E3|nr:DNA translocase FtsK 4TM domain-containing protein [Thermodesulfobacterium hydrogeniphilum]
MFNKKTIIYILILFIISFLTISIYSFNPYDPGIGVFGAEEIKNLGGVLGAYLSSLIYFIFGFSSVFIPPFMILGLILYLFGVSFKRIFGSLFLILICFSLSLTYLFGILRIKNTYLFNKYPLNGGLIGELSSFLISFIGTLGFFLFIILLFIIAVFIGLRFPKKVFIFNFKSFLKKIYYFFFKNKDTVSKKSDFQKESDLEENKYKTTIEQKIENNQESETEEIPEDLPKKLPPPLEILEDPPSFSYKIKPEELKERALLLVSKLKEFGIEGEVVGIFPGPVITVFEFKPAPGIKISKIQSLVDDLALGLSAKSVRIVAPIPGKSVIGIEISNPQREWVYLKEILQSPVFQKSNSPLTIALGKDISGNPIVTDLRKMPHLLIAGSTGSGKSIFLHSVILSLIYKSTPEEIRFLMIDPKRIELSVYEDIPYLLHPVVLEPKLATKALRWLVNEMERRYTIFEEVGARNLESYNENFEEKMPYIVMVIDELADLMVVSSKEVETLLTRLAQMARAAGIHLLVATQRPSVDVITGLIKVNFPARISFQVTSKVDSRTILDTQGAERLLGAGDMLFMPPGSSYLERIHGPYISEKEVKKLAEYLKSLGKPKYLANIEIEEENENVKGTDIDDPLYEEALKIAYQYGKISVSMLQRKLKIGYNRAARLVEKMEEEGIVGPSDGVRPRPVLGPRKPL